MQVLHLGIDSEYIFKEGFIALYKNTLFKYCKGENNNIDCIIALVNKNVEDTYTEISEFISVMSYAKDQAFNIKDNSFSTGSSLLGHSVKDLSDLQKTNLITKLDTYQPGVTGKKSRFYTSETCPDSALISLNCPKIDTQDQDILIRLYRIARYSESFNKISSFNFYYLLIDYDIENKHDFAKSYINNFESNVNSFIDPIYGEYINEITRVKEIVKSNQVFNKSNKPIMLGTYIRNNIRHAIAHIIRNKESAVNLKIDSFEQESHLKHVVKLMRFIARDKLNKLFHQLDSKFLENSIFTIFK